PWRRHAEPVGDPVRYTASPDGTLHVIMLDPSAGVLRLADDLPRTGLRWDGEAAAADTTGASEVPGRLRGESAAVLTIEGGAV
ncbi:MAG TPA: hypothetical protein VGF17_07640, partial [Phytomonospora sp.]